MSSNLHGLAAKATLETVTHRNIGNKTIVQSGDMGNTGKWKHRGKTDLGEGRREGPGGAP
jgi:hypothetical protein